MAQEAAEGRERGGGIAAAAPQSGSCGEPLFQRDLQAAGEPEGLGEEARRPAGQILLSRRDARIVASKRDFLSGMWGDPEPVVQRDRGHSRRELMKSIGATPEDAQVEVDFRRGEEFNSF